MYDEKTVVCSLLGNNFEIGLGALINSLCTHGFTGTFAIGYKGHLPTWIETNKLQILNFENTEIKEYKISENQKLLFFKIDEEIHLSNYKPTFIIELFNKYFRNAENIFYFDPDIIITTEWKFYENWVKFGIALCEDTGLSPMNNSHPIKKEWCQYFQKFSQVSYGHSNYYINAGFIGVHRSNIDFLFKWEEIVGFIRKELGNLNKMFYLERSYKFHTPDQDALNFCLDCFEKEKFSICDRYGMSFARSNNSTLQIMFHYVGSPKPWERKLIFEAIRYSKRVNNSFWIFWNYLDRPINVLHKHKKSFFKARNFFAKLIYRLLPLSEYY